jgi:hypothetical protein
MPDDDKFIWFAVRGRRSTLHKHSKISKTAGRSQTFAAALAQFEEQYTAAKVVTEITRPLNLYYGLAQAGMAIAAAHAEDPWSFSRHGLRLADREKELADMNVAPEGDGGFQKVATATASPLISAPVRLGALWRSLPELSDAGPLPGSDTPAPILLLADMKPSNAPHASLFVSRDALAPDLVPHSDEWKQCFAEIMSSYPGTDGIAIPAGEHSVRPPRSDEQNWRIDVAWLDSQDPGGFPTERSKEFFDRIAPEHRYREDRFLRPAIDADGSAPPSPLMTWWLLLYSFSILARYEPRNWAKILDVDKTRTAVQVQYALTEALTVVPQLVIGALDREPFLLWKPLMF